MRAKASIPAFDKEMFGIADLRGNDDDVFTNKKKSKNFNET